MAASPVKLAQYIGLYGVFGLIGLTVPGPWKAWSTGKAIDPWFLTHIFWGWLGARMDQSFKQQMALTGLNEVLEFFLRRYRPDIVWGEGEPGLNVPMDFVGNAIGWYLGRRLGA